MGVPLAFSKAQLATTVTWIGYQLTVEPSQLRARMKDAIFQDLCAVVNTFAASNVVSSRELCAFIGKCSHVASLVAHWRPCLRELYGALGAESAKVPN
eukprot:3823181-Amphidinium_carterae.1